MMFLIGGIVIGTILATVCFKIYFPPTPVGGKLTIDMSNSDEIIYQLVMYDQTGEKMKNMKRVLVDVEVSEEVKKNEADSN